MLVGFSFFQAPRVFVFLTVTLWLTAASSEDQWIVVKRLTPNPVFVTVGQTLKLRLDIENLQVDRWNTTAFWVYSPDGDAFSPERELQWVRRLGSETELHYTYNETRVSRERQMDLVMKSMTLGDSGVYRCKFRKPPNAWQIRIEYNVIVEEDEAALQQPIVYVTRGDTLKLKPMLPETTTDSDDKNYKTFWDFSTPLTSQQEGAVRIIGLEDGSLKSFDARASLEENGTTLVLKNTTFNDSGVYHLRTMKSFMSTINVKAIRKDFRVVIEDKPVAHMQCKNIVRLSEGENFFCLCEDISASDVKAKVSWLRNGHSPKHFRRFHEEELYLKNVSASDAGYYVCKLRTETKTVEVTLEVLISPAVGREKDTGNNKKTQEHPDWHYLAGSLGVGIIFGIVLVLVVVYMRRKCRNTVYEDVCKPPESPDLELDITEQYQDMNRETSAVYEEANTTSPYEIADLTCPIYMDMNEGRMGATWANQANCRHQNETTLFPGYTNLDHRKRVDSHPYQGLQQFRSPGDNV